MRFLKLAVLVAAIPLVVAASAAGIGPGSPAPALSVKKWYKGTPVKELAKDKIYVVEFWATWCGPCRESIPHITELAKKNKDVTFVGVSIWEDEKGDNISKFVKDMGAKMNYNIGYSGNKDGMAKTWMEAAAQNGIPSSFIVKGGVIQWIGHPMELEKPLAEVKSGKFNLKAAKANFDKEAEQTRNEMAARKELNDITKLYTSGDKEGAKTRLAALEAKVPTVKFQTEQIRFGWLAKDDPTAWAAKAEELANAKTDDNNQMLAMFAMNQAMEPDGDKGLATKAIGYALKASEEKDIVLLYYGGLIAQQTKEFKEGLRLVDKALSILPTSAFKDNDGLKKALQDMRKDLASKAN